MPVLKLEKPITVKVKENGQTIDKELTEINFDFNSLTGKDVLKAERTTKILNPRLTVVNADLGFLGQLAAIAGNVPFYELEKLPGHQYAKVTVWGMNYLNGLAVD
ncbi:hypothetical protein [Megamonas hypermegale]|uniref:hypothetical protein n=1 Tax=Megamonas hypermegale TaxID=158847 RepID=UPI0025A4047A|nr:hypothetical protein [Megamonas hypermegale]MDM8143154.1 hypothetical protein [Megamonas hypermegale]